MRKPVSWLLLAAVAGGTALAFGPTPAEAGNRRDIGIGPVTVVGPSDVALCIRETGRGELDDASYWCDRAIRRAESSYHGLAVAHLYRGLLRLKLDDASAALSDLDKAINLVPDFGDAHLQRGNALQRLGRNEEAVAAYASALAQGCTTPEIAHYNRAIALRQLGRVAEAEADLAAARAQLPQDSPLAAHLRGG